MKMKEEMFERDEANDKEERRRLWSKVEMKQDDDV
jgi:hypothetical protein